MLTDTPGFLAVRRWCSWPDLTSPDDANITEQYSDEAKVCDIQALPNDITLVKMVDLPTVAVNTLITITYIASLNHLVGSKGLSYKHTIVLKSLETILIGSALKQTCVMNLLKKHTTFVWLFLPTIWDVHLLQMTDSNAICMTVRFITSGLYCDKIFKYVTRTAAFISTFTSH